MLFDKLCTLVERSEQLKGFRKSLENAKIFKFCGNGSDVIKQYPEDTSCFTLPFDTVAVEDDVSVVVIGQDSEDRFGLDSWRYLLEYRIYQRNIHETDIDGFVAFSRARILITDDGSKLEYNVLSMGEFKGKDLLRWHEIDDVKYKIDYNVERGITRSIITSLEEMSVFSIPEHFILEKKEVGSCYEKKRKKLLRTHERPLYTVLKPQQARQQMGLPEPDSSNGSNVCPHERRGHYRLLRHERYAKNDDGTVKRIWVKPTWIGPSENKIGKHIYRVILD